MHGPCRKSRWIIYPIKLQCSEAINKAIIPFISENVKGTKMQSTTRPSLANLFPSDRVQPPPPLGRQFMAIWWAKIGFLRRRLSAPRDHYQSFIERRHWPLTGLPLFHSAGKFLEENERTWIDSIWKVLGTWLVGRFEDLW